jgi:hypothetical protein
MRLGKLLSVGEVTEAAEAAGPEPAVEPVPPVTAEAPTRVGHRAAPATAQPSR